MNKTWFIDVDGCILKHANEGAGYQWMSGGELLPGVRDFFDEAEKRGDYIVLVTGRLECCRGDLEGTLREHNLFWHQLVMGVGHGVRVLVNDKKGSELSAMAANLPRNEGLGRLMNSLEPMFHMAPCGCTRTSKHDIAYCLNHSAPGKSRERAIIMETLCVERELPEALRGAQRGQD